MTISDKFDQLDWVRLLFITFYHFLSLLLPFLALEVKLINYLRGKTPVSNEKLWKNKFSLNAMF